MAESSAHKMLWEGMGVAARPAEDLGEEAVRLGVAARPTADLEKSQPDRT